MRRIAARLGELPAQYDFVDGYTWHFFASFDYYTSIERRMMFFRYRPDLRWEGSVHERLLGAPGRRVALPYVYAHYGHTLEPRRHAEKGRHYSSLGAPGNVLREDQLDDFDVVNYYRPVYPRLLRFRGTQPPAARATVARLRPALRDAHALTERVVRSQPPGVRGPQFPAQSQLRAPLARADARSSGPQVGWMNRDVEFLAKMGQNMLCLLARGGSAE